MLCSLGETFFAVLYHFAIFAFFQSHTWSHFHSLIIIRDKFKWYKIGKVALLSEPLVSDVKKSIKIKSLFFISDPLLHLGPGANNIEIIMKIGTNRYQQNLNVLKFLKRL